MGAGDRLGDAVAGRPAAVVGVVDVTALALDQRLDQMVDVHVVRVHIAPRFPESRLYNHIGLL